MQSMYHVASFKKFWYICNVHFHRFKMSNNDWKSRLGVVFSTSPDFAYTTADDEPEVETLAPERQNLRIRLERKGRGGKTASIVDGFVGSDDDLESLAKMLKSKLGTGGSAKDGIIIIQGDVRDRLVELLLKAGYSRTKKG